MRMRLCRHRLAAPACLFLLVLLSPVAAGAHSASLVSRTVEVNGGTLSGDLLGAAWEAPPEGLEHARFDLTAARASVDVDQSDRSLVLAKASLLPDKHTTSHDDWMQVNASLASFDPEARILVLPGASVQVATHQESLSIQAGDGRDHDFVPRASATRPTFHVPGTGLQVKGAQTIEVRGDFEVVLSGLVMRGTEQGGDVALDTRRSEEPYAGTGPTDARKTSTREAVLFVHEGVLTAPSSLLSVSVAEVQAAGLGFEAANGSAADGARLEGETVQFVGALDAFLEADMGFVRATVGGPVDSLRVDSIAVRIGRDPGAYAWVLMAGGALPVGLGLNSLIGRWRFQRLDRAMDGGDYARALRRSRGFRLHPLLAQDAALAGAICLTALGRPAEACAALRGRQWSPSRRPTRDFLLARGEALLDRPAEATRLLASSLLADPGLAAQARADPALSGLLPSRPRDANEAYA